MHRNLYQEWLDALKAPVFDAEQLAEIHRLYQTGLRRQAVWEGLYKEQRRITLEENEAAKAARRAELAAYTKRQLMEMFGITNKKRRHLWTKNDIIESQISIYMVEDEHSRVRRIWAAMSEAEREGIKPHAAD